MAKLVSKVYGDAYVSVVSEKNNLIDALEEIKLLKNILLEKELGQKDLVIVDGGDESSPALMIKSPFKVYKRSLNDDLHKIFHS